MGKSTSVYERAVKLLSARDHGRTELARKLRRKGCPADEVDEALDRLAAAGFLDDAGLAGREVDRLVAQGRGPRMIRQKLRQRGFDTGPVDAAIAAAAEEGRFAAGCRDALRRRFGVVPAGDRAAWLKAARFLAGRGFTEATVRAALDDAEET